MRKLVKRIHQEIKLAKVKYKVTVKKKLSHLYILIDHHIFALLKKTSKYATLDVIFKELSFLKIAIENFSRQVSFKIAH